MNDKQKEFAVKLAGLFHKDTKLEKAKKFISQHEGKLSGAAVGAILTAAGVAGGHAIGKLYQYYRRDKKKKGSKESKLTKNAPLLGRALGGALGATAGLGTTGAGALSDAVGGISGAGAAVANGLSTLPLLLS